MRNNKPKIKKAGAMSAMALLLLAGSGLTQSCTQDVLDGQPSWLGNSIYEQLKSYGNYNYTIRLIDDLDQTSVLSQTGSKTLFIADDAAFEDFFKSNTWGIGKYEDLSTGQKKILLNSAMVNNAYLIELLSNLSGNPPEEGSCMRRETAVSVLDSVAKIAPEDMPDNEYWNYYKKTGKSIILLRDNTGKPMIHFLPAYMQYNKITSSDLSILTNGESNSISDSWVNGKKVIESDITCKNGYLHKVDGVMVQSDNMAQIIKSHANMSTFSKMLDRFAAPFYDANATKEYNRIYNNTDSVFTLKYFATTGNTGDYGAANAGEVGTDPKGNVVESKLLFDPGWNQYYPAGSSGKDLHYDCGAMLVPTDEALNEWWNGGGKVLQDMYGSWENVPTKVLVKLINMGMVNSFSETVPSKFANIVDNTTKVSIKIQPTDVDSCFMGCNGVVYLINKVFPPADYSSVSFPALVNEKTMNVIYWGISQIPNNSFEPYLNSMDSYYSFFIPTNTAMLNYVDPCSYGNTTQILYQFYFDNDTKTVKAHRYKYDLANHQIIPGDLADASDTQVQNRLVDMINNLIVVGDVEDGKVFYKTKSGGYLKVTNPGNASTMTVAGGLQVEQNRTVKIESITDKKKDGNGKSYIMNEEMPMTSQKSTYAILKAHPEFSKFYELMTGSGSVSTKDALMVAKSGSNTCADMNVSLFDAYNYTVYVPTNAAIEKLHADGYLPYWTDIEALKAADFGGDNNAFKKAKTELATRIINFLKYHIQDNSVIIGGADNAETKYETFTNNPKNKRFYSLTVSSNSSELSVTDLTNKTYKVKTSGLYNIQGREYWIRNKDTDNDLIYNASDVVVHQIDGALIYSADQLTDWKASVGLSTTTSAKVRRR